MTIIIPGPTAAKNHMAKGEDRDGSAIWWAGVVTVKTNTRTEVSYTPFKTEREALEMIDHATSTSTQH